MAQQSDALAGMVVVSCAIGAYAIQKMLFDICMMLGFGVVGYVFKKIGIPLAPLTLALGNGAEDAFRLSMIEDAKLCGLWGSRCVMERRKLTREFKPEAVRLKGAVRVICTGFERS